jgi:hypothetical protein
MIISDDVFITFQINENIQITLSPFYKTTKVFAPFRTGDNNACHSSVLVIREVTIALYTQVNRFLPEEKRPHSL